MSRLTDKTKKKILADRVNGDTIRTIAKRYRVSTTTIQRILNSDTELAQKVTEKKEQNTRDVLQYMDECVEAYKLFCDYVMGHRMNPSQNMAELEETDINKLMTIVGIWTDKMLKAKEILMKGDKQEHDKKIDDLRHW